MDKQKIEKIILVVLVVVAGFYLYWTYLFQPQWSTLTRTNQEIAARTTYLNRLTSYQDSARLQQDLVKEQELGKQLSSRLPSTLDKPRISVEVYLLAKQQGVNPQSITFEPLQNKENHQELDFTFVVQGQITPILNMLSTLQQGSTLKYSLKNISLSTSEDQTTATLRLTAYSGLIQESKSAELADFLKENLGVGSPVELFRSPTK